MKRLSTIEFHEKLDEAHEEWRQAVAEADRILRLQVDLATIQNYGPNWLETGKVGGWDEQDDEWPWV